MIKKIQLDELRMGMFVHKMGGSWIDHPFWRAKFTLETTDQFDQLKRGADEVWIDTSKGPDVESRPSLTTVPARTADSLVEPCADAKPTESGGSEGSLQEASALVRKSLPKVADLFRSARLGKAIDLQTCDALVDEICASSLRNPDALLSVVRLKRHNEYTYMHSIAVCVMMVALGRRLGLEGEDLRIAGQAGLFHDLGKALIPVAILDKPAKLSPEEFESIKAHPRLGFDLLVQGGNTAASAMDACLHHHERFDGKGYPDGLAGEAIGLIARMASVCDVYDAITSRRPYSEGWDPGHAIRQMATWEGHFDPTVFRAFVAAVGIYPVGSLVRLRSGRLGVITRQNSRSLSMPTVRAFFSTKADLRITPVLLDLSSPLCTDEVTGLESNSLWHFKDLSELAGLEEPR